MLLLPLFLLLGVTLSCDLADEATVSGALGHLVALNKIAYENNGNRAAGSSGYTKSVEYVLEQLGQTDYDIQLESFAYDVVILDKTPEISQNQPSQNKFVYGTDFSIFSNTPSGTVVAAPLVAVSNVGCQPSDYENFQPGSIALVLRGSCTFSEKEALAVEFKATAIIIYNSNGQGPFNGRIDNPKIPSFTMAHWLGKVLALQQGVVVSVSVSTTAMKEYTTNIVAETRGGNPDSIIVVGSHLDGVPAGPGINDNGSGSSTNLELALATFKCLKNRLRNKIRFAWWGAEELGLLGSSYYVSQLSPADKSRIALNLNFDMLASPNYFYGIYNGSSGPIPIRTLSAEIQRKFEEVFEAKNTPFKLTAFDGRSDYGPFIENGIPAGGLATGAEGVKTMEERELFGGLANAWYDPCYHAYCDSIGNIAAEALKTNIFAASTVLQHFATTDLQKFVSRPEPRRWTYPHSFSGPLPRF